MLFTKLDAIKAITKIRVNFPNAFPTESDEQEQLLIETWYECLEEYPAELVARALKESLKTAKFAPKIGDITEKIEAMRTAYEKSDAELWAELMGVLREVERCAYSFKYTYVDESGISQGDQARNRVAAIFDNLDPVLKDYCRNQRGLVELAQYTDEQLSFERGRFIRVIPQMRKNARIRRETPSMLANLVQGLSGNYSLQAVRRRKQC